MKIFWKAILLLGGAVGAYAATRKTAQVWHQMRVNAEAHPDWTKTDPWNLHVNVDGRNGGGGGTFSVVGGEIVAHDARTEPPPMFETCALCGEPLWHSYHGVASRDFLWHSFRPRVPDGF